MNRERQLARVRALLAKAESTTPEEAEALTAKAESLIVAHAIELGELSDSAHPEVLMRRWFWADASAIGRRRLVMSAVAAMPGAYALYNAGKVAQAVRVWAEQEATLNLVDSLLVQAQTAMELWWMDQDKDPVLGRRDTRRSNFLWGFGVGVARRFEALKVASGPGAALVLADASRRVREHVQSAIKVNSGRRSQVETSEGFHAGVVAGEDADTGGRALERAS